MDGVGGELLGEDVVVGCVANRASDDADGKGERCDGADEVLKFRCQLTFFGMEKSGQLGKMKL